MEILKKVLVIGVCAASLTACGKSDVALMRPSGLNSINSTAATSLDGVYSSGCNWSPMALLATRATLRIQGNQVALSNDIFSTPDCRTEKMLNPGTPTNLTIDQIADDQVYLSGGANGTDILYIGANYGSVYFRGFTYNRI